MIPPMRSALSTLAVFICAASPADEATPQVPAVSGPITGPGRMYPEPAVSVVPGAPRAEDFPYVTEEYFVSGVALYPTRADYVRKVNRGLDELIARGWLLPEYADMVRRDAERTPLP